MPSEAKGDVFVGSTSEFETESGGDAVGVCDDAEDVKTAVVIGVWISEAAGEAHDVANMLILKHGVVGVGGNTELS